MFSALPIFRSISRYVVPATYIACSAGVLATGFLLVTDSRRSAINFGMCVILAMMLFFIGVASTCEERDGMDLGDFDDEPTTVALGEAIPEMHLSRSSVGQPPRMRMR